MKGKKHTGKPDRTESGFRGRTVLAALLAAAGLTACGTGTEEQAEAEVAAPEMKRTVVDTSALRRTVFRREVVSTGKVSAARSAELRFATAGPVAVVRVRNGQYVRAGEVLAELDRTRAAMNLEAAANALEKAELNLLDRVVGFGYGRDTAAVPPQMMRVARIQSGYKDALHAWRQARYEYDGTQLTAPFAGRISNLDVQPGEVPEQAFCRLADTGEMMAEFVLLESEADFMKTGTRVRVVPYADPSRTCDGEVTEVNPVVDERGQVRLKARIRPPYDGLIDGMSVKVFLEREVPDCYVVPKSAVVIRDGYNVVFLYDAAAGCARWLYVDILQSNSTEHVIGGNREKDTELPETGSVIVSGNLNLAEGSAVQIAAPEAGNRPD